MAIKKTILLFISLFVVCDAFSQSARFAGIGYASVCLGEVWSATSNQAGLTHVEHPIVAIGYENKYQLSETSTQALVVAIPTKSGNIAASLNRYGYSVYSENSFGLAYARKLGEYISAAVQFDYINFQQSENYGNKGVFIFETGIIANPINDLFIGAHIHNPTRVKIAEFENERLPTTMRFGLAYYFTSSVLFNVETEKDLYNKAQLKSGIEYQAVKNLYLRTGLNTNPSRFSFGLGYKIWNFTTDIAFITHESLPLSTEISLSYSLKK